MDVKRKRGHAILLMLPFPGGHAREYQVSRADNSLIREIVDAQVEARVGGENRGEDPRRAE